MRACYSFSIAPFVGSPDARSSLNPILIENLTLPRNLNLQIKRWCGVVHTADQLIGSLT
jgi:hypothetical protein